MSHFITRKLARTVQQAPKLLTILVWTAGVVGFTAWTINDFIPLLDEYRYNNVDTQVAIVRNETAWPPNLTVCIPYYSDSLTKISDWLLRGAPTNSCLECDALEQRGWDVWTDINLTLIGGDSEAMKTTLVVSFMQHILNASTNGLEFLAMNRSNFNWNQPLLDAVWQLLRELKTEDFAFFTGQQVSTVGLAQIAEEIIRRELLDELNIRAIAAIEVYYQRRVARRDNTLKSVWSEVPLGNPTSPFEFGICFQASTSPSMETFQYVAYNADEIDPPWIRTPRSTPFSIWMDDEATMYGSAPELHTIYETAASNINCNYEAVDLEFAVDLKVVETRPDSECIRDEPLPSCTIRHFLEVVLEKCSCLPFGYKHVLPYVRGKFPYCSVSKYSRCSSNLTTPALSLLDTCSNQCEFISRKSSHTSHADKDTTSRDLRFRISFIHMRDSPYVEFSITKKTSWQQFVSNIGGTVGLYLGFSGLSIVALLVFCMEHAGKWLAGDRQKKVRDSRDEHHASEENPKAPAMSKRVLLADIVKMIQEQQRITREEMLELLKASEEATAKNLQKAIWSMEERFAAIAKEKSITEAQ